MQFKEFRPYEAGDDIRHMSWNVTARTGHPTVKIFEEERELNVVILVDVSGSTLFGQLDRRKIDMYAEIAGLVGLAAVNVGDPFGALLFSNTIGAYLPPRRNQDHVRMAMLRILEQPLSGAKSDLRPALAYIRRVLKTRSLIIIVSDFLLPPFQAELQAISQRHEVILLHGFDNAERGVGLDGLYPVWNPETGEYLVLDGGSKRTRGKLEESQNDLAKLLQNVGRSSGSDYLSLSVEEDYLKQLVTFFHRRSPRS